jgi:hypothetical protein
MGDASRGRASTKKEGPKHEKGRSWPRFPKHRIHPNAAATCQKGLTSQEPRRISFVSLCDPRRLVHTQSPIAINLTPPPPSHSFRHTVYRSTARQFDNIHQRRKVQFVLFSFSFLGGSFHLARTSFHLDPKARVCLERGSIVKLPVIVRLPLAPWRNHPLNSNRRGESRRLSRCRHGVDREELGFAAPAQSAMILNTPLSAYSALDIL